MAATVWSWEFNRNRTSSAAFDEAPAQPPINDEYWQRLLKAVPVQAVGFITAADALGNAAPTDWRSLALLAVFAFGLLLAYLEMKVQRRATSLEIAVAIGAYVIWVYAQGGVFNAMGWYQPVVGGLLALGFAALLPFVPKPATS